MINQFPWRTASVFDGEMIENDIDWINFVNSLQDEIPKMITDGKTDGWNDIEVINGQTVTYRYWATEEAAQEWAALVTSRSLNGKSPTCTIDNIS